MRGKDNHRLVKWGTVVIFGRDLPHRHFPVQNRLRILVSEELFSSHLSLSFKRDVAKLSLFYSCVHRKCSDELDSLISQGLTFTSKTRYATYIVANHIHSLRIPLQQLLFTNHYSVDVSPITEILTCCLELIVIFLLYSYKLFLHVTLCLEWTPGLYSVNQCKIKKKWSGENCFRVATDQPNSKICVYLETLRHSVV